MKLLYDPANLLQMLLVQEFRTCQKAFQLLQEEQRALLHGNTQELLRLAVAIDSTLETLERIAATRLELVSRGQKLRRSPEANLPGLQEGVHILRGQIFAILRSNIALAGKALDHTQALQSHLTRPVRKAGFPVLLPAVLENILDARQALEAGNHRAISGALDNLQNLVACLENPSISASGELPVVDSGNTLQPAQASSLVEKITALNHQQNAYRAVFQSRQRMLSLGS